MSGTENEFVSPNMSGCFLETRLPFSQFQSERCVRWSLKAG